MSIDFSSDLDEMLSADDHGVSVEHSSGTFEGIINREFREIDVGKAGMEGWEPAVYMKTTDAENIDEGDDLIIDSDDPALPSGTYTVATSPEPDGTGLSRVALHG